MKSGPGEISGPAAPRRQEESGIGAAVAGIEREQLKQGICRSHHSLN
jgi:hypothetical protein